MAAPDPYTAATALLAAFVDAWNGRRALPDRRWVAEGGDLPWDGEQVTVAVGAISPGLPSPSSPILTQRPRAFPVSSDLIVEVVRNRKAGLTRQGGRQSTLPTKTENVGAGAKFGDDLMATLNALLAIRENGSVVSHPTKIAVREVRPVGPQGDLVGVRGTVSVLLGHGQP